MGRLDLRDVHRDEDSADDPVTAVSEQGDDRAAAEPWNCGDCAYAGRSFRLAFVLAEIADADYRGNRSPEAVKAHRALVAEGLRAA